MKLIASFLMLTSLSAFAFDGPASKTLPLRERFKVTTIKEELVSQKAQKFIAYLSLATQSVFYGLKAPALSDIASAEKEAKILLKDAAGMKAAQGLPLGKISGEDADVYVPVWVADGISEDLKAEKRFFKTRTTIENAKFVFVTVSLNMADTILMLEKARTAVKAEKYMDAMAALNEIKKQALVSESDVTDPVLTVWANLSLAEEFLYLKDYGNARYTLKQVKTELARLEKEKILSKDSAEVKVLENDIGGVEDALVKNSPTLAERGKAKIQAWKLKIKNWM